MIPIQQPIRLDRPRLFHLFRRLQTPDHFALHHRRLRHKLQMIQKLLMQCHYRHFQPQHLGRLLIHFRQ